MFVVVLFFYKVKKPSSLHEFCEDKFPTFVFKDQPEILTHIFWILIVALSYPLQTFFHDSLVLFITANAVSVRFSRKSRDKHLGLKRLPLISVESNCRMFYY